MKISKQARRDAKDAVPHLPGRTACWTKTACARPSARSSRRSRAVTSAILSHFQRLVKLDIERRTARVESAVPLRDALAASGEGEPRRSVTAPG